MTVDRELEALRAENDTLKREVKRLGDDMEREKRRRTTLAAKKVQGTTAKVPHQAPEVRAATAHNEELRKERLKLTADVAHSDTGRHILEAKSELKTLQQAVAEKRAELKSLDNQRRARKSVVDQAMHTDEELRLFQQQHREALNGFKAEAAHIAEHQKSVDRQLIAMQEHMHRLQERVKLGVTGEAYETLRRTVEDQDAEIARRRTEVERLSANNAVVSKREDGDVRVAKADRQKLKDHLALLQTTLLERERELKLSYAMRSSPRNGQAPAPLSTKPNTA